MMRLGDNGLGWPGLAQSLKGSSYMHDISISSHLWSSVALTGGRLSIASIGHTPCSRGGGVAILFTGGLVLEK